MQAGVVGHRDAILSFSGTRRKLGFAEMKHCGDDPKYCVALLLGETQADHALQDCGKLRNVVHTRNGGTNLAVLKVFGCMEL